MNFYPQSLYAEVWKKADLFCSHCPETSTNMFIFQKVQLTKILRVFWIENFLQFGNTGERNIKAKLFASIQNEANNLPLNF